jgi:DNA-nicking Smr family endonuclease
MSAADREGRRRRDLSDEEQELWTTVTRSVPRLRRKKPKPISEETAGEAKPAAAKASRPSKPQKTPKRIAPHWAPEAPLLAPLERRLKQRLARGTQAIDSRIDLHGLTESQAHDALLRFLRSSQIKGAKVVLVITGKGRLGREHGVLRRAVPLWLKLPEFRVAVVGFEPASVGHGGEGALYVRVRKIRNSPT